MSDAAKACPARTCSKLDPFMFNVAKSAVIALKKRQGLRALK